MKLMEKIKLRESFSGSYVFILIGFLLIFFPIITGLVVILGTLAYRSAKKRKLGLKSNSFIRISLEIIAIISILALLLAKVLLANVDIKEFIAENPVRFLIWVWSLIPYFYIVISMYIKKQSD